MGAWPELASATPGSIDAANESIDAPERRTDACPREEICVEEANLGDGGEEIVHFPDRINLRQRAPESSTSGFILLPVRACRRGTKRSPQKRKEPPGNRAAPSLGRIVPTEARPSELSGCIVGAGGQGVKNKSDDK